MTMMTPSLLMKPKHTNSSLVLTNNHTWVCICVFASVCVCIYVCVCVYMCMYPNVLLKYAGEYCSVHWVCLQCKRNLLSISITWLHKRKTHTAGSDTHTHSVTSLWVFPEMDPLGSITPSFGSLCLDNFPWTNTPRKLPPLMTSSTSASEAFTESLQ